MTVKVEIAQGGFDGSIDTLLGRRADVQRQIKEQVGFTVSVEVVEPGSLPASEGKAKKSGGREGIVESREWANIPHTPSVIKIQNLNFPPLPTPYPPLPIYGGCRVYNELRVFVENKAGKLARVAGLLGEAGVVI